MKKKITFGLFIIMLASLKASAQFVPIGEKEAQKVTECALAVVLMDEDEAVIKKLAKRSPDELTAYRASVKEFNTLLRQVLEKEWDISKSLLFINSSEAQQLLQKQDSRYCLLEVVEKTNYKMNDFYSSNRQSGFNTPGLASYRFSSVDQSTMISIKSASNPKKVIASSYLPALEVPLVAMTFMVQHLENQLTDCLQSGISSISALKKEVDSRSSRLKKKTLLFYDPLISKDLQKRIERDKVSQAYSHAYEVSSAQEVEEVIINHNPDYAYTIVVPAGAENHGKEVYNYFIVDALDGRILYMTGKSGGGNGKFHTVHLLLANREIK